MSDESGRWKDHGARIKQAVVMRQVRPWEKSGRGNTKPRTMVHERLAIALATLTIPIKGKARTS